MTASEFVDRRYLAGISIEDATTGVPVRAPLRVVSRDARFFRNAGGVFVVSWARGLEAHLERFESPPVEPAAGSVPIGFSVSDDSGYYLPRLFTLRLPRSSAPDAAAASSLFEPLHVPLYRSPRAELSGNWSAVHARLLDADSGVPVRNALVRAVNQLDGALLAVAPLIGPRHAGGERALGHVSIPIAGIPSVSWSATNDGAVLLSNLPFRLEIVGVPERFDVWDPDEFLAQASVDAPHGPFQIASGRRLNVGELTVTVPN